MAADGMEIIDEIEVEYQDWHDDHSEAEWSIRTLKIWFFMLKDSEGKEHSKWPEILDDKKFMETASAELESVTPELHSYLLG